MNRAFLHANLQMRFSEHILYIQLKAHGLNVFNTVLEKVYYWELEFFEICCYFTVIFIAPTNEKYLLAPRGTIT